MSASIPVELPQSDEAERSVLGAILVDNAKLHEVADLLVAEDFYRPVHQRIYRSMVEMSESSQPVDLLTLAERHAADGTLDAAGGPAYLSRLMDGIPRMINVRHYAAIVRERSIRRQLVKTASELATEAQLSENDVGQVLGRVEQRLFQLSGQRSGQGFATMKELLARSLDDIEKRQAAGATIHGVPSGFTELDELTSGFQQGDLIIIAARPGMGKTSFALSAAQNAAIRHDKKIAIFSLEMGSVQLAMRVLCSEARVDAQRMRHGQLGDDHWSKLVAAYGRLAHAPIWIDETSGISVTEMRAKCRRLAAEKGLDMVIVDYLQLMGSSSRVENRQQEISAISRSLKEMAREMSVPVIALSQLSRAPEQRQGDHRPMLSDLRESGCLSGDALVVMADGGRRVPIRELAGRSGFSVLALNEETCRLEAAVVSRAFATGTKPVSELRTRLGRSIRATANHRFRAFSGWKRLDELSPGDRIALPRVLAPRCTAAIDTAYCSSSLFRQNMGRERAARVAAVVESPELDRLATSDVYWDEVASISPAGTEEVFDLTVPNHHNFIADDIIVHNSLEQDADIVAFIFREEVYRAREGKEPGDKEGIAELIVEKQRNGPTGKVKLAFIRKWTRFENLQREGGGTAPPTRPRLVSEDEESADDVPTPF